MPRISNKTRELLRQLQKQGQLPGMESKPKEQSVQTSQDNDISPRKLEGAQLQDGKDVGVPLVCLACGGTGVSTRGYRCVPCELNGRLDNWNYGVGM